MYPKDSEPAMSPEARRALQDRRQAAASRQAKMQGELDTARREIDALYARRGSLSAEEQGQLEALIKERTAELGKQLGQRSASRCCPSAHCTAAENAMQGLIALEEAALYLARHD